MGRIKKAKALRFTVNCTEEGMPYIETIEFDSHQMSTVWGRYANCSLGLNAQGEPEVYVYIGLPDVGSFPIVKSPFTGGDIETEVPAAIYETVVQALSANGQDGASGETEPSDADLEELDAELEDAFVDEDYEDEDDELDEDELEEDDE